MANSFIIRPILPTLHCCWNLSDRTTTTTTRTTFHWIYIFNLHDTRVMSFSQEQPFTLYNLNACTDTLINAGFGRPTPFVLIIVTTFHLLFHFMTKSVLVLCANSYLCLPLTHLCWLLLGWIEEKYVLWINREIFMTQSKWLKIGIGTVFDRKSLTVCLLFCIIRKCRTYTLFFHLPYRANQKQQ